MLIIRYKCIKLIVLLILPSCLSLVSCSNPTLDQRKDYKKHRTLTHSFSPRRPPVTYYIDTNIHPFG